MGIYQDLGGGEEGKNEKQNEGEEEKIKRRRVQGGVRGEGNKGGVIFKMWKC